MCCSYLPNTKMSDVAERIQFILKRENLTYGQFAERIGVATSAISHFVNRRNKPSLDALAGILVAFPNISPDWLLLGVGNFSRERSSTNDGAAVQNERQPLGMHTSDDVLEEGSTKVLPNATREGSGADQAQRIFADTYSDPPMQRLVNPEPIHQHLPNAESTKLRPANAEQPMLHWTNPEPPQQFLVNSRQPQESSVNSKSPNQQTMNQSVEIFAKSVERSAPTMVITLYPDGTFESFSVRDR